MGDISIRGRSPLLKGGRVGFKQGGAYGPLRGTTAGGVAKAFRGKEGFKESQALQKKIMGSSKAMGPIKSKGKVIGTRIAKAGSLKAMGIPRPRFKSEAKFQNFKKRIEKTPDKVFHQKGYIEPGATKSTRAKVQKKKIIQAERTRLNKQKRDPSDRMAQGGRIGFKRAGPVTKADLAKSDLWRKRELKRRSKIGRKSKWDIKGGIGGHPLNPFRMHAESKALDWGSKRKDVYVRTRDDLKKSQDPEVKKVAEGFQQMDYKDKARSDPRYIKGSKFYKEHQPKLTKRIHVGRKTGGKI